MTLVRYRGFTCTILIDTLGRFLLQHRDDVAGIVHPGKIGLFGGHREDGETYLQCIVREAHEELSYYLAPERFEYIGNYDATDIDHGQHGHSWRVFRCPGCAHRKRRDH